MRKRFISEIYRRLVSVSLSIVMPAVSVLAAQSIFETEQMLPRDGEAPKITLNGSWKFKYTPGDATEADKNFYSPKFDSSGWSDIKVPSNWELQGFGDGKAYGKKIKKGTGLYIKEIAIPEYWTGKDVFITFDGVSNDCALYVNGDSVGYYNSAFNRKSFNVTPYINPGHENLFAVRVTTQPRTYLFDSNDDWALSGIHRDVTLFALPKTHIRNISVTTPVKSGKADVNAEVSIVSSKKENATITGVLTDSRGRTVATVGTHAELQPGETSVKLQIPVANPMLWTAEAPALYTLVLSLSDSRGELQHRVERVGIREITTDGGIFKINGTPVKLHGATHHDISTVNGRSVTEEELKKDIAVMRDANMNFLRTSHYPPNQRLLELCDSIGMYVMDEVPYGFGEPLLEDESYLPELLLRADLTLLRDRNHPCVVMWSVGNENPATPIGLETGRYVHRRDATRPYTFPQGPKDFVRMTENMPDSLTMISPHYPTYEQMEEWGDKFDLPMVVSEYAHALGTDFGQMQVLYEIMQSKPKVAGGSVWELFDQGVLTKSSPLKSKWDSTNYVWPTDTTFYDTHGCDGTDGLMYADRYPKTNYWQARKVYSYVIIPDTTFNVTPGRNNLKIVVKNRYDFTDLNTVEGKWRMLADGQIIETGVLPLNGTPHTQTTAPLNINVPKGYADYWVEIVLTDKDGRDFYEKSIKLAMPKHESLEALTAHGNIKAKIKGLNVKSENYVLQPVDNGNGIKVINGDGVEVISDALISKVGRKVTITEQITRKSRRVKKYPFWEKMWMPATSVEIKRSDKNVLDMGCVFVSDSVETAGVKSARKIEGQVKMTFDENGIINVDYDFTAEGEGASVEAGYGLLLPETMCNFRWLGNGPYASYPSKDRLSEYGVWQMNSDDIYFPGNRMHVDALMVTDSNGNGFVMFMNDANVSFERHKEGLLVSHNCWQTSAFNKHTWPEGIKSLSDVELKGHFSIMPVTAEWSPKLRSLFGAPEKSVPLNKPYYHSYDQ